MFYEWHLRTKVDLRPNLWSTFIAWFVFLPVMTRDLQVAPPFWKSSIIIHPLVSQIKSTLNETRQVGRPIPIISTYPGIVRRLNLPYNSQGIVLTFPISTSARNIYDLFFGDVNKLMGLVF